MCFLPQHKDKLADVVMLHTALVISNLKAALLDELYFSSHHVFSGMLSGMLARDADFLKNNHLRITEDLSPAYREKRLKLWPAVEKARKENKKAFFVGGRALVDGVEISPPI